jgi:hypothetical protein
MTMTIWMAILSVVVVWSLFKKNTITKVFNTDTQEYKDITAMEARIEGRINVIITALKAEHRKEVEKLNIKFDSLQIRYDRDINRLNSEVNELKRLNRVKDGIITGVDKAMKRGLSVLNN